MNGFDEHALHLFHEEWALAAAGNADDHNAMTISWGGMGTLWGRPVATIYVKPIRYTWTYLEQNDYFTVSFYDQSYRKALSVMGTLSGRDGDKAAQAGLTPLPLANSVTFAEAEVTLLCRKIYWQDLDPAHMPPEEVAKYYTTEAPHRMYVGEVIEVIRK